MTHEDRALLIKDLCARLPYGVQCEIGGLQYGPYTFTGHDVEDLIEGRMFKPYLRQMSSMTEEEKKEYQELQVPVCSYHYEFGEIKDDFLYFDTDVSFDYLNSIHVDYRGLIDKGLAIEVTKENNPYKQ